MNLWYLVFRTDSLTFTVCRALRELGHEVMVWVTEPEHGIRPQTHDQARLAELDGVRIIGGDPARLPGSIDRLIVQTHPRPVEALHDLPLLAQRARAITLISAGDCSREWRQAMRLQWLEIRRLGSRLRRVDRVLYKDGFHRRDLHGLLRPRRIVGFDVHSHFLRRADHFDAMHARNWDAATVRPYLLNFLGSQDPAARKAILDAVRMQFIGADGAPRVVRPGKSMFWHEYSDAHPAGLSPTEFVAILTRSDFTLCPRGYSRVTHRPMEAMLRGSIPVLDAGELNLYGIDLADGNNCIAVPAGRWPEAVERIVALPEAAVRHMRENLLAMRAELEYRLIARGICARLGIDTAPVARHEGGRGAAPLAAASPGADR